MTPTTSVQASTRDVEWRGRAAQGNGNVLHCDTQVTASQFGPLTIAGDATIRKDILHCCLLHVINSKIQKIIRAREKAGNKDLMHIKG